ncbi:MAG: flavodoxin family protein [Desulfovibrio sp.]
MKILNIYASLNGQTEKVAKAIGNEVEAHGFSIETVNVKKDDSVLDLLSYDLIFVGSGVYTWLPSKSMQKWMDRQMDYARTNNLILPGSPRVSGRNACVYCTYAGPHTGVAEAIPAVKYMGQLFDHLGITVVDEWCIVGAFVPEKMQHFNTTGRLGDISERPNDEDLRQIRAKVIGLLSFLTASA